MGKDPCSWDLGWSQQSSPKGEGSVGTSAKLRSDHRESTKVGAGEATVERSQGPENLGMGGAPAWAPRAWGIGAVVTLGRRAGVGLNSSRSSEESPRGHTVLAMMILSNSMDLKPGVLGEEGKSCSRSGARKAQSPPPGLEAGRGKKK